LPTEFHHLCPELVKNRTGLLRFGNDRPLNRLVDRQHNHRHQHRHQGEDRGAASIPYGQGRGLY
jgi:hypothetical protein